MGLEFGWRLPVPMSYTVLARKWRPRRFAEMVGQQHVVKALVNSLGAKRLHHAYLFAGTRGVGKTTVARILAKALNCASGIVAEPCGNCDACMAIDEGRFVDLIEVDAASRTRVDDTRELLENTQYTPAQGRFKVYLIDEVHMLSNHSFNALLKTLEEPPPHIKFLLATTNPQKLPVTVLSRCLQFNLKRLTVGEIYQQLEKISRDEEFATQSEGLKSLARSADGSMRDGLSLLDQAIAFSGGEVTAKAVSAMLGSIDRHHIVRLLQALAAQDGSALLGQVADLDEQAPDYGAVLDELMGALQRIAVLQLVGSGAEEEIEELPDLATAMSPEDVQLYYQIALQGRRDLSVCRDYRSAFEMTLLRMLAFRPNSEVEARGGSPSGASRGTVRVKRPEAPAAGKTTRKSAVSLAAGSDAPERPAKGAETSATAKPRAPRPSASRPSVSRPSANRETPAEPAMTIASPDDWNRALTATDISGAPRQLAEHCAVSRCSTERLELVLAPENAHLNTEHVRTRLQEQLRNRLSRDVTVTIAVGEPAGATPARIRAAGESERMRNARASLESDPAVKEVQAVFDAVLEVDSISPLDSGQA